MTTDEENANILDNTTDADVLGKKYKFPLSRNEVLELMALAGQDKARQIFAELDRMMKTQYPDVKNVLEPYEIEELKKKFVKEGVE